MNLNQELKNIVVMYHAHCPDGMAAAWTAWKKFGYDASYIPISNRNTPPDDLVNRDIYILDFCFPSEILKSLHVTNNKVIVLDHHISSQLDAVSIPGGIFDQTKSGAGMTWDYFFPGEKRPKLLNYIEIGDLNPRNLPPGEFLSQRIIATPFTIDAYDKIINRYEKDQFGVEYEGEVIGLYVNHLFEIAVEDYDLVLFEGYTIPAINIALPLTTKSQLLALLIDRVPPMAMSYRYQNGYWKVSIRGNGSVDCALLASKYGGGGHKNSAGFIVKADGPLPFASFESDKKVID
ncbi:hypothetical protein K9M47_02185 [Candidatus Gracilibacteria bacterium]|nr:hypothetical protein [Candidatus Gracilibacteria bacterium]